MSCPEISLQYEGQGAKPRGVPFSPEMSETQAGDYNIKNHNLCQNLNSNLAQDFAFLPFKNHTRR